MQIYSNKKDVCLVHWHFNKKLNPKGFCVLPHKHARERGFQPSDTSSKVSNVLAEIKWKKPYPLQNYYHKCYPYHILKVYYSPNSCFSWKTSMNWHIQETLLPKPDVFDILNWKCIISSARETSPSAWGRFAYGNKCSLFIELLVLRPMNSNY